jgi:hypothetical protein
VCEGTWSSPEDDKKRSWNERLFARQHPLQPDGGREGELDGRAGEGGPHDDGLGADLVGGGAAADGRGAAGEGDGDGGAALVALGGDGDGGDGLAVGGVVVRQLGVAVVAGHAVDEDLRQVVVLLAHERPVGQARHLLHDVLGPGLDQRKLAR